MDDQELEKTEIKLFLEALYQRYGYDFRHYAQASLRRRVRHFLLKSGYQRISDLLPRVLQDEDFAQAAIDDFSIVVSEMFRDPEFYVAVRHKVVPYLRTYPFFKVWIAGCGAGEEVYSLAILLQEERLSDRATLFATDLNRGALRRASDGIYALKDVQHYTANYHQAGGQGSFADYYHAQYQSAIMDQHLRARVTFAEHNLVTDGVFSEVHLIFCRNVLIYFDSTLQKRVLSLLSESLCYGGFLCLGTKEILDCPGVQAQFRPVDLEARIYQKKAG